MHWFTKNWWLYLLEKPVKIENFLCRINGHKGVIWYNSNGFEPDMHCKNCGDDLG